MSSNLKLVQMNYEKLQSNPLISVLIPTFNVSKYIADAINSILDQTYENFEIIIIDDHSTDETYEILQDFEKAHRNIILHRNSSNLKIAVTLNNALALASGEYIIRMDGDDISEPERLERYLQAIMSNPDLDILGSSVVSIDESGRELGRTIFYEDFNLIKRTLKYRSPCAHIWIAKVEVYKALGGYRNIPGAEDYDFLLRAITSGFKVCNIEDYFGYKVRLFREGNTLLSAGLKQKLQHKYVYRLYLARLSGRPDNFSPNNLEMATEYSKLSNIIFKLASRFLNSAISYKASGSHYLAAIYTIAACISPHQASYLVGRMLLKFKIKGWI